MLAQCKTRAFAQRISGWYAGFLLSFYLLTVPPAGGGYGFLMEWKYAFFAGGTLLYALCLLPCLFAQRRTERCFPARAAALCYLACAAVSAFVSPYFPATLLGGSRREGLLTVFLYVTLFYLLSRFLKPGQSLLWCLAAALAAADGVCLWQLHGGNPLGLYPDALRYADGDIAYAGRYVGTMGNADFTGVVLAMGAAVLLVAATRRAVHGRGLLALIGALSAYVLARIDVSGATLALGVTLLAFLPLYGARTARSRRRLWLMVGLLLLGGLAALWFVLFPRGTLYELSQLLRGNWQPDFGSGRFAIWRQLPPLIAQHPLLGGGPDTLWLRGLAPFVWIDGAGSHVLVDITAAHSEYLNLLVEQGTLGLLCYLTMLGCVLFPRRTKRTDAALLAAVGAVCYLLWAAAGISSCVSTPLLWLALAVICAEKRDES